MYKRNSILVIGLLIAMIPVAIMTPLQTIPQQTPREPTARFTIASWSYPDAYGQGIETIYYSTRFPNDTVYEWGYTYPTNESHFYEVPHNGTVYLRVTSWVNGTLLGISSLEEAKNRIRFDMNVTVAGVNVLTQQNWTLSGGSSASAPMYIVYRHIYISGFHGSAVKLMSTGFVGGQVYVAVLNCEVFY